MRYEVKIYLNAVDYEIEATDEEEAIKKAYDKALEEPQYDLLKWADYEVIPLVEEN